MTDSVANQPLQQAAPVTGTVLRCCAWPYWVCVVSLLALHVLLAFDCARRLSVTHDEYWHLPVGLLNLTTGRFDSDNLNPPLVRMWAALPLLATAEVPQPLDDGVKRDAIGHGDAFLDANRDRYDNLFLRGRAMIVVLSLATGLIIAVWARSLFGERAAVLSVLLWSACPTALMNASLVTTDMGAAFFFALCGWTLWRHARHSTWKSAILFGLCLGLAQLVKYTALALYPLAVVWWPLMCIDLRAADTQSQPVKWTTIALQGVCALVISVAVINAGY